MSVGDSNNYNKKKNQVQFYLRWLQKEIGEVKPETEETPDQFVICLKNYLAKWLELPGSSAGDLDLV